PLRRRSAPAAPERKSPPDRCRKITGISLSRQISFFHCQFQRTEKRHHSPLPFSATLGLRMFASQSDILLGPKNLQAEDKQHRLITQLSEFRRHRIDVSSIPVETRLDCEILLAADLEGHRGRVDAAADIEPPQFFQTGVVVSDRGAVRKAGYQQAA